MTDEIASHEMSSTPPDPALSAAREGKINVAMIGLCGCWGCTLSFLDMDERIIPLLTKVTIHRSSLTDIKRITERCAIGFIEGGVANEENIETLRHFRDNCDVLISVGACAIWGGVPEKSPPRSLETSARSFNDIDVAQHPRLKAIGCTREA